MNLKFTLLTCFIISSISILAQRPVGINLSGVTDYSPEIVFTDAFKQCRTWIAHVLY